MRPDMRATRQRRFDHARSVIALLPAMLIIAALLGLSGCKRSDATPMRRPVVVFAAASTAQVVAPLLRQFEADHGVQVRLNTAASSTLARQIQQGAPADIFLSANARWMDRLQEDRLLAPGSRRDLLSNRLAVVRTIRHDRPRAIDQETIAADARIAREQLAELLAGLAVDRQRMALGDPGHVPAGIYARSALRTMGLWEQARPHIAPAKDVRSALMLVERGEVGFGIVYQTDARSSDAVGTVGLIPCDTHEPICYPIALTVNPTQDAALAFTWLTSSEARRAFEGAGFVWQLVQTPMATTGKGTRS